MGITVITRIDNRSGKTVAVSSTERQLSSTGWLAVGPGTVMTVDVPVPWATSVSEFTGRHLKVAVSGQVRFWIWQAASWDGDHVRFCRNGVWVSPGPRMSGAPVVEPDRGERTLIVRDGCVELVAVPGELLDALRAAVPSDGFVPTVPQPPSITDVPSVPRRRATAFSMAGPPWDAFKRGEAGARFRYRDSGKRYEFSVDSAGTVTATDSNGLLIPLREAVSYSRSRVGERFPAPPFDLIAANDSRVIAKATDRNQFFFASVDELFVHADGTGLEVPVPSMYFKRDPEAGGVGRRAADLLAHLEGCFADHPAVERFPLFRVLLGLDVSDLMIVKVQPRVWHLIDARPPLGPFNVMLPLVVAVERVLETLEQELPPWPELGELRRAIADWEARAEEERIKLQDPGYDAYALPAGIGGFLDATYTNGSRTLRFHSIRYERVLDVGVGHAHWHAVYDGSTGGELQPMHAGPAVAGMSWSELYRLVNGPIRDGDGYIDGTANFYALVQLLPQLIDGGLRTPNAFGILYLDEQSYFSGRWRLVHPDDYKGGGFAVATALASEDPRPSPLNEWDATRYWCPFRAGNIDERTRMAVSRQVIVVNGVDPQRGAELYSINFSYSTMDHSWRRRPLPPGARVAYFPDEASAAVESVPAGLNGDVVYPQTVRLREDLTLILRGSRGGVPGRWFQRYLPADNRLVPAPVALTGSRPSEGFSHPWRFITEEAFTVADEFSHLGVYDSVDSRSQYYPLTVSDAAAAVVSKSSAAAPWVDTAGQLFVRAVGFYWSAPLRVPDFDVHAFASPPVRPKKKAPPSIFNPVTQLRILKRGNRWIATHWDKRDDDLMPFDPIETLTGHPAVPPPAVSLTQGSQTITVTVGPNERVLRGPVVKTAEFVWTGTPTEPVAIRLHSPDNVWRVRLGALVRPAPDQPRQAIILHSAVINQFRPTATGLVEHRWRPSETDLALMREACSDAGAVTCATSIWFEDLVGHVALPDRLRWLRTMTVTSQPSTVPLDKPTSVTVRARDVLSGAAVRGTVTITGSNGGTTDTAFTTTFSRQRVRVFDPERHVYVTELVEPVMTVQAPDYVSALVPLSFYQPQLRVSVDQSWLPVGPPAQVTVRTVDAHTGAPVTGRVLLNGTDVAATNTTFTYTCGSAPPSAVATAAYYPSTPIPWPPLRVPRLTVTVQPHPAPLRTAVAVTVRAIDADSGAPVDGTVTINNTVAGRTNTAFTYTFTPTRTRVFDPELRIYTYEIVMPTGVVTAAGYPTTPIDFGF